LYSNKVKEDMMEKRRNRFETTDASTYQLLLDKAREMRKNPTEAEAVLWNYLSDNKMGVHFRRQHPVYGYIPDFVCLSEKIIIEIDGGYHFEGEQLEKDAERTRQLNEEGFIVLRFTNEEVLCDIDNTLEEITNILAHNTDTIQTPLPSGGAGGGFRVGMGYDVHRLVPDRELWMGGIKLDYELGLLGHSDADVLIHAICDAILGAANMRDIGYHWPDTSAETEGMDSKIILKKTIELIATKGYQLVNIDATICAERPKMNPHIPEMQQCMANIIGCDPDQISIKATTTEKLGFTGRQEGISAYAVALIEK
jgi:2-C-methyl-D-erythritol 2,4-cyclodiphosphate synthase